MQYTQSDGSQPNWSMLSLALSSKARWVIIPMQDFIDLDVYSQKTKPLREHAKPTKFLILDPKWVAMDPFELRINQDDAKPIQCFFFR